MRRLTLALGLIAALAVARAARTPAAGGYTITDLGTLGGTYSEANAISEDGKIAAARR